MNKQTLRAIVESTRKEFRNAVYEPVHEKGGVCWCGVLYSKEVDGKMHITHQEQRDKLSFFIDHLTESLIASFEELVPEEQQINEFILEDDPEDADEMRKEGYNEAIRKIKKNLENFKK